MYHFTMSIFLVIKMFSWGETTWGLVELNFWQPSSWGLGWNYGAAEGNFTPPCAPGGLGVEPSPLRVCLYGASVGGWEVLVGSGVPVPVSSLSF